MKKAETNLKTIETLATNFLGFAEMFADRLWLSPPKFPLGFAKENTPKNVMDITFNNGDREVEKFRDGLCGHKGMLARVIKENKNKMWS